VVTLVRRRRSAADSDCPTPDFIVIIVPNGYPVITDAESMPTGEDHESLDVID